MILHAQPDRRLEVPSKLWYRASTSVGSGLVVPGSAACKTLYIRGLPSTGRWLEAREVILVVLLFGPPGCGKGTQAGGLAGRFGIPAISTGEMFRAECKAGTDLGRKASSILAAGGLVGDDIVNGMVARRIAQRDCAQGFLLDGYPRTVPQAQFFAGLLDRRGLAQPVVVHLDVSEEVLVERLGSRRQCPRCLRIYNLLSQPPRRAERCDDDNTGLITREDDQPAVIRQRLRAYEALTGPILGWYGATAVHRIDGAQQPAAVTDEIERVLMRKNHFRAASAALKVARV